MFTWKAVLSAAGVVAIFGASLVWWTHNKQESESRKLSDAATEAHARADQGDVTAEYKLAQMYYFGQGVPQDYEEAYRWSRLAAEHGYAKAQFGLGDLYFRGKGVHQNFAEAVRWTQKAADQGYAKAQAGLGYMYFNGVGVSQNNAEAFLWYSKAANQENVEAEYALGYMYTNGIGLPQDYYKAVQWIQKAANQGDADAQVSLGTMYVKGQGVKKNRPEAYRWFRKAADQSNPEAKQALKALQSESMTKMRWIELIAALFAIPVGLWASLEFLLPGRKLNNRRQAAITLLGISFISSAGLSLYAFAHYEMQCSSLPYAFHITRFLFTAVAILIVFTVVLPAKNKGSAGGPVISGKEQS
jgi:TPR repeat protein